jgi:hypothetical protein
VGAILLRLVTPVKQTGQAKAGRWARRLSPSGIKAVGEIMANRRVGFNRDA